MSGAGRRAALVAWGVALALLAFTTLELSLRLLGVGDERPFVTLPTSAGPRVARAPSGNGERGDPTVAADRLACAPQKADGTLRVIVVGESTVAGFPFHGELSFARLLEWALRRAGVPAAVEVVNFGRSADSSDDVRAAAIAALALAPDALVVASGHNEFQSSYVEPLRDGAWARLRTQWRALALVRAGQSREWRRALPSDARPAPLAVGEAAWLAPTEFARGVARYRANLAAIGAAARAAGVPLLLMTPVENLAFAPCWSHFTRPLDGARRAAFRRGLESLERDALALLPESTLLPMGPLPADGAAQLAALRARAAALLAQDDGVARLAFLAARLADRAGDAAAARDLYARALECDGYPNRAGPRLAAVVRELAARGEALLVDPQPLFAEEGGAAPGSALFLDYCHPTLEGTARLAESLVLPLLAALQPKLPALDGAASAALAAAASAALRAPAETWLAELGLTRAGLAGRLAATGLDLFRVAEADPSAAEPLALAGRAFEQALRIDRDLVDAWLGRLAVAIVQGEVAAALQIADNVWRSHPEALQKLEGLLPSFPRLRRRFEEQRFELRDGRLQRAG